MITFEINKRELRAMRLFVSRSGTRAALETVCVELKPEKTPLLIATDGSRIAVLKAHGAYAGATKETCLIPDTFIGRLLRVMDAKDCALSFDVTEERITANLPHARSYSERAPLELHFPKWRQVIPRFSKLGSYPSRQYAINGSFLGDFSRAATILNGKESAGLSILSENEIGPVVIRPMDCDDFYAVLMPMRDDGRERPIFPDWIERDET